MAPRATRHSAVERLKFKDKLAKAGLSTDALLKKIKARFTVATAYLRASPNEFNYRCYIRN
jgi:hypothetical protein